MPRRAVACGSSISPTRTPTLIDTGFAIRNNNDHVLSFDGTQLAISDQSTADGQSTIFTMPTRGGVPKRITPLTPSYMHGWTPDAKWLVYTGGRRAKATDPHEYDIYKIASDGSGKEINLTNSRRARRRPGSESPTASGSTSTPCARARCRSGACARTAPRARKAAAPPNA